MDGFINFFNFVEINTWMLRSEFIFLQLECESMIALGACHQLSTSAPSPFGTKLVAGLTINCGNPRILDMRIKILMFL